MLTPCHSNKPRRLSMLALLKHTAYHFPIAPCWNRMQQPDAAATLNSPSPPTFPPLPYTTPTFTRSSSPSKPLPPPPANTAPDALSLLIEALNCMGQPPPPPPQSSAPPSQQTCIRPPDTFNGSNLEDLQLFLVQCQLTSNSTPQRFTSKNSKV